MSTEPSQYRGYRFPPESFLMQSGFTIAFTSASGMLKSCWPSEERAKEAYNEVEVLSFSPFMADLQEGEV